MSKAGLVSFILDLKLDRDGRVKIFEFGDLYLSGYSGYERLTRKSPLTESVFPFYEGLGLPVFQGGDLRAPGYQHPRAAASRLGIMPVTPRPDFNPEVLGSHAALVTHASFTKEDERKALKEPPYDQVIATNVNGLVNACSIDKGIMTAFAQRFAPDLFPKQKIYPVNYGQVKAGRILDDFRDSELIVLKNTWEAQADGVDIIRRSRLNLAFNLCSSDAYLFWLTKPSLKADEVCVVQEYVPGTLIKATNENGREGEYDPTMRVILTAWHDNGKTYVKCHDAYYKIPSNPADSKVKRRNSISKVHDDKGPKSAFVPDDHKAAVFAQLEERLPAMMHGLFTVPAHQFAKEFMDSDDPALRRIGVEIATNRQYFDRPEGTSEYPADLADRLFALREESRRVRDIIGYRRSVMQELPDGAQQALTKRAEAADYDGDTRSLSSIARLAFSGFVFLAAAGAAISMAGSKNVSEVDRLFSDDQYKGTVIKGLSNLRFASWHDAIVPQNVIDAKAKAAGYELCQSEPMVSEAESLFNAFVMAKQNPQEKFAKVDLSKNAQVIKDGMVLSDNVAINTLIYGTKCPPKPER